MVNLEILAVVIIPILIALWKVFSYAKKLEEKVPIMQFEKFISKTELDVNSLKLELTNKVDKIRFEILLKDIEILKKDMITTNHLKELEESITREIRENGNRH